MKTLLFVTEILDVEASSSREKLSRISVSVLRGDSERPYELAVIENTPEELKVPVAILLTSITISSGLLDGRAVNILCFCFVADETDIELHDDDDDFDFLNLIFGLS
jgi:hypothetical protein